MSLPTLVSPQALETLDNGKPYVISYLVDLDMVLKCLRYGLCSGHHEEGGRDVGKQKQLKGCRCPQGLESPLKLLLRKSLGVNQPAGLPSEVLLCLELCLVILVVLGTGPSLRDLMCWSSVVQGFQQSSLFCPPLWFVFLGWLKSHQLF